MDLGLRGKKAIITGATDGLGRAVAELLADEGVDIGFCGDLAKVDATAAVLRAKGVSVVGSGISVREGDPYKAWLEQTVTALSGCDIFIVNTSLDAGQNAEHSWSSNFEIDILHTVRGCETLIPHLKTSGNGAIVILGASGTSADPALISYTAFQAGLVTYSKQLSQFVGRDLIRVNLVAPAPTSGSVSDIAKTVAFLASPAASLMTGAYVVPGVNAPR